jgi:putative transposase
LPNEGLGNLCALFGVTRQAYYESMEHFKKTSIAHMIVLTMIKDTRDDMPLLGTRRAYFLLKPEFIKHGIKMGRDQLFDLLRFHGLLIRRRKRMVQTTNSNHWLKRYPNLIKQMYITDPEQLWVSDITYIKTLQGFSYLSLITDAYSRKIVGYSLHDTLEASSCINALRMAIANRKYKLPFSLVHHSDRGVQYCCAEYVDILNEDKIAISMTQSGSPYDNALAERVNGIIKNEFYPKRVYQNHKEASKALSRIIDIYNSKRPHSSINYLTPEQAHKEMGILKKQWKQYKRFKKPAVVPELT